MDNIHEDQIKLGAILAFGNKATMRKTAAPLIPLAGAGIGATAALAGLAGNVALKTIPAAGNLTGNIAAESERIINEDDLTTEQLKAQIIKYRILTAQLDREINKRFLKKDKEDLFTEIA